MRLAGDKGPSRASGTLGVLGASDWLRANRNFGHER